MAITYRRTSHGQQTGGPWGDSNTHGSRSRIIPASGDVRSGPLSVDETGKTKRGMIFRRTIEIVFVCALKSRQVSRLDEKRRKGRTLEP